MAYFNSLLFLYILVKQNYIKTLIFFAVSIVAVAGVA
jgi:hypothetical protein